MTTILSPLAEVPKQEVEAVLSPLEMQQRLQDLQKKGISGELTNDEIREAIGLIRALRRTNTGPAASAEEKKARRARGKHVMSNEELLRSLTEE